MSKRRKGPDPESPEEMRKKFFLGAGIVTVGIIIAFFAITKVVPRAYYIIRGETNFEGQPTSYWEAALSEQDPKKYGDAMSTLRGGGDKALPVLLQLLKSSQPLARYRAARLLSQIGNQTAVSALVDAQKDPDPHTRCMSAYALAVIAPDQAVSVPSLLEFGEIDRDMPAVDKVLPKIPIPQRYAGLVEACKHPSVEVRFKAVNELAALGPDAEDSAPVLISLLRDRTLDREGYSMADRAATALAAVNPDARGPAVEQLIKDLQDKDGDRAAAVFALGRLRAAAKPAVPLLLKLVEDKKDPKLASEARDAVEAIYPKALEKKKKTD